MATWHRCIVILKFLIFLKIFCIIAYVGLASGQASSDRPWYESLPAVAMDYKVHVDAGKEDCYYQYVQPGAAFYVSFQVSYCPAICFHCTQISSQALSLPGGARWRWNGRVRGATSQWANRAPLSVAGELRVRRSDLNRWLLLGLRGQSVLEVGSECHA